MRGPDTSEGNLVERISNNELLGVMRTRKTNVEVALPSQVENKGYRMALGAGLLFWDPHGHWPTVGLLLPPPVGGWVRNQQVTLGMGAPRYSSS